MARQLAEGETVPDRTAVPDEVRRYTSLYIDIPPEPMEGPRSPNGARGSERCGPPG